MRLLLNSLLIIVLFSVHTAWAQVFHVSTQAEFETALSQSASNGQDDRILVYKDALIQNIPYEREAGFSLTIEGGYDADFKRVIISIDPSPVISGLKSGGDTDLGVLERQKSTTGPTPPPNVVKQKSSGIDSTFAAGGATQKVLGVPGYEWRHGCGPTAVGMVVGYYDVRGFDNLYDGSAASQTYAVNQGIASQRSSSNPGHYEDYSLPMDDTASQPIADKSQSGGTHVADSIADYMHTSWSSDGLFYGWSYSDMISPALISYVKSKDSDYTVNSTEYDFDHMPWNILTNEIDNDRPMIFLVDTNADGYTDHFVTVVGYRIYNGQNQYGCLDTWAPASEVRWSNFSKMKAGTSWGVWGGGKSVFSKPVIPDPPVSSVNMVPILDLLQ